MPARPQGVYSDGRGGWYLKTTLGSDPLTGKRVQITKRGYRSAGEAARWQFHLDQERQRVHESHYAGGVIPLAA